MKKTTIASGKGGTGKTTFSVNLAVYISNCLKQNVHLIDCDVEEPNDLIFFDIKVKKKEKVAVKIPIIDESVCTYCGLCAEVCEFNAIAIIKQAKKTFIAKDLCHACGVCSHFCPVKAINEKSNYIGEISYYKKGKLQITEGKLNISEATPTLVLTELLKNISDNKINILDAPPGTSCSMVKTVGKSDFVILITEPTPFGLYDLKLAIEVLKNMNKKYGVVINKAGLGNSDIYYYLEKENIPILMELPFDKNIAKWYSKGEMIIDKSDTVKIKFGMLYNRIIKELEC